MASPAAAATWTVSGREISYRERSDEEARLVFGAWKAKFGKTEDLQLRRRGGAQVRRVQGDPPSGGPAQRRWRGRGLRGPHGHQRACRHDHGGVERHLLRGRGIRPVVDWRKKGAQWAIEARVVQGYVSIAFPSLSFALQFFKSNPSYLALRMVCYLIPTFHQIVTDTVLGLHRKLRS